MRGLGSWGFRADPCRLAAGGPDGDTPRRVSKLTPANPRIQLNPWKNAGWLMLLCPRSL